VGDEPEVDLRWNSYWDGGGGEDDTAVDLLNVVMIIKVPRYGWARLNFPNKVLESDAVAVETETEREEATAVAGHDTIVCRRASGGTWARAVFGCPGCMRVYSKSSAIRTST